jgi:hypothetical protein
MSATQRHTDLSTQSAGHADARIVLGPDSIDVTVTPLRVRISARGVACLVVASATPAALLWAAANSTSVSGYFSVATTVLVYLGTLVFLLVVARHAAGPGGTRALPPIASRPVPPRQDSSRQFQGKLDQVSPDRGDLPTPPLGASELGQSELGDDLGAPLV